MKASSITADLAANPNAHIKLTTAVQPFGIWLLRIISPLSRTGKYRRKQLSRLLFRLLGLGDGFPFLLLRDIFRA